MCYNSSKLKVGYLTKMVHKKNQGNQTETVKQALICHIHDLYLKPGDRLPSQAELRQRLGVGGATIQRAVEALRDSGIVEIKPHRGVILRNAATNGMIGREIGFVSLWRTFSPAVASELQSIQLQLHQNACQQKLFLRNFPEMTDVDSLSYFDGLKRCIELKQLNGLLTTVSFDEEAWDFFEKHNLPVVSTSSASRNKGFRIERFTIEEAAFKQAVKRGFKRPALISCGYPHTQKILETFHKYTSLPAEKYCCLIHPEIDLKDISVLELFNPDQIIDRFAAMPEGERPDVLIIPDDILMASIFPRLQQKWASGSNWKPFFIYIRHKQIPILPSELINGDYFEFDSMKDAEITVSFLLDVIRGKEKVPRSIVTEPRVFEQQ